MCLNLNQQSTGSQWQVHKNLMSSMSPIVDCGVHYVDMMCQMTQSRTVAVHAIRSLLTDQIVPEMYNYGQLQVTFEDGSVGWYESGWGPMISETAYFIQDTIGPKGSVSIRKDTFDDPRGKSADIGDHTKVNQLHLHHADLDDDGELTKEDQVLQTPDEPGHDELCFFEQQHFIKAIREDLDLTDHMAAAVQTLQIVLACDESVKTGKIISL